jgi:hypothetical protein
MTIDLDVTPVEPTPRQRQAARRSRWTLAGLVAAVVLAAAAAVVLGGSPPPAVPPPDLDGHLRWVASLVDAPPRGALAADESFTRELTDRVEDIASANGLVTITSGRVGPRPMSATMLFAEDIEEYRVALLSLRDTEIEEDRRRYALAYVLWIFGPRGATPETLMRPVELANPTDHAGYSLEAANPVTSTLIGDRQDPLWVLLAPPGCELATAPAAALTEWTPDPTGYLARRLRSEGPLYWRATCDGVVREEAPAPRPALTDRDVDGLVAGAQGRPERERLAYQASYLVQTYGSELVTLGRVLWSGPVTLSPRARWPDGPFAVVQVEDDVATVVDEPTDTTVTVLAGSRARGGWLGSISTVVRTGSDVAWGIDDTAFVAPAGPHGLIAVRLDRWQGQVLVLAPMSRVATVRLVGDDGQVLDESPVDGRPVVLTPGQGAPRDDLYVIAVDASGSALATVELADTNARPDRTTAWDA